MNGCRLPVEQRWGGRLARQRSPWIAAMVFAWSAATVLHAQVELREGGWIEAPIIGVSIEGVELGGESPTILGWDRVRQIDGAFSTQAAPFETIAKNAWRARIRLERGDITLAQPVFEELFETYRSRSGPTAAVVAEGLLRCRLARLAQTSAIEPWLVTMRLRREGWIATISAPGSYGSPNRVGAVGANIVIDEATNLAVQLPPIWLDGPAVAAMARQKPADHGDPASQLYRSLFLASAALAMGQDIETLPATTEAGAQLVTEIIRAMNNDPAERTAARRWLSAGLARDEGTWREAWRRAALGRSLLLENSFAQRRLGLVQLLHLPARFRMDQRYLAGMALALASLELRHEGEPQQADRLREELVELGDSHPALDWLNRHWNDQPAATAEAPAANKETS